MTIHIDLTLTQLETAQLVRRLGEEDTVYIFKHALTQDTAYESLLKQKRRVIHRQVAETIEQLYPDRLDENAALLAQHYALVGDDAKTLEFSMRAGDVAARIYANLEALTHYSRALEIARRIPEATSQLLCDLFLRRGRVLELSSQFKSALEHYADMEKLAQARGDRTLELAALAAQCQIRCTANSEFSPDLGENLANRTAALARELGDHTVEAKVYWDLLNLYRLTNRLMQARTAGEQSIAIARKLNLREQLAYTLNDISHVYTFSGDFSQAKIILDEAARLWRELNNLPMLADCLATMALDGNFRGDYQDTIELGEQALKISQSIANLWGQTYSLSTVGVAYWARGDPGRAIASMEETLRLSDRSGYLIPLVLTQADLAIVYAKLGATERGIELAERALLFAVANYELLSSYAAVSLVQTCLLGGRVEQATTRFKPYDGKEDNYAPLFAAYLALGKLQLVFAQNDYARVIQLAPEILTQLRTFGLRSQIPEVLSIFAQAQRATGQIESARTNLDQARAEAEALGARWDLWQILAAIGDIEDEQGNAREAETLRDQAHAIITDIAKHIPVSALRDSFLNTSQVRKVMGGKQNVEK